uniref:Putative beta-arrestin 1 n=1 Tax=Schistosoma mansoni TaxID=6183 RepID=A0A5K4ES66_SCHMA
MFCENGVILISQDLKATEYVFLILTCSYRFGRDDLDVLGLTFQKELLIYTKCLWPNRSIIDNQLPVNNIKNQKTWKNKFKKKSKKKIESIEEVSSIVLSDDSYGIFSQTLTMNDLTPFQLKMINKNNQQTIPFRIILPPSISPSSVAIQTTQGSNNKPYGINYELTAFIGQRIDDNQPASSTVTIVLRKLTAGPKITQRPLQPIVESIKKTINLPCYYGELFIKASIEKPLYYHDESVCVSIVLDNLCQLPVRKLQVAIVQIAEVFVLTKGTYRSTVDKHFCKVNLPQAGEEQWKYTTILNTNLTDNILKRGVALDGYIRQEKNWLASSTVLNLSENFKECLEMMQNINKNVNNSTDLVIKANKELHGIVISYCVRVRCWIGISRCSLYIPFLLMQPEKESEEGEEDNHVNCTNNHTLHVDIVQIHPSDLKVTNDELVEISNDNKSTV